MPLFAYVSSHLHHRQPRGDGIGCGDTLYFGGGGGGGGCGGGHNSGGCVG